ncbi:sugar ABC transporter permease, partial [Staphylococcus aureus]
LRAIAFVPAILSGVVLAYIWSTILTDRGVLNSVLGQLGLSALQTSFLGTQTAAQISVIAVSIWPTIGFTTVIYLAGLQG